MAEISIENRRPGSPGLRYLYGLPREDLRDQDQSSQVRKRDGLPDDGENDPSEGETTEGRGLDKKFEIPTRACLRWAGQAGEYQMNVTLNSFQGLLVT